MEIGNVLNDWRTINELTLKEASSRIGLPLKTLDRIERGSDIEGKTMMKLIAFLFGKQ
jgi:transcriptional regulator with XRE-family HTH domain